MGANFDNTDIEFSRKFLCQVKKLIQMGSNTSLDIAAGIGRISQQILQYEFHTIDLVEPV